MPIPHVVVVPYPVQGHVTPLIEFSKILIKHGIKITFVNTEFSHERIMNAFGDTVADGGIRFVSVSDGMGEGEDRNQLAKAVEALNRVMPGELKRLVENINRSDDDEVTCILADMCLGWEIDVAGEMGVKAAALWTSSVLTLASAIAIPRMIEDGVIDENGTPLKSEMIQLLPDTPSVNTSDFFWTGFGNLTNQKAIVDLWRRNLRALEKTEWLLCNSMYDLEAGIFASLPKLLPVGPLSAYEGTGTWSANFWREDDSCLNWLDQQPQGSVVYVAFGSSAALTQTQFREMAMGLELSNKRFLWVVRPDSTEGGNDAYPEGFQKRVADRGKIVGWAPQQIILGHPAVACFVSHCGWNSTMEGISNGVPFLCLPYCSDQFWNESYICETLKVGLKFERDENGITGREEIKRKVEEVVEDEKLKERALELKKKIRNSVKESGSSGEILQSFIQWLKPEKVE